jgi:hypothetical protein
MAPIALSWFRLPFGHVSSSTVSVLTGAPVPLPVVLLDVEEVVVVVPPELLVVLDVDEVFVVVEPFDPKRAIPAAAAMTSTTTTITARTVRPTAVLSGAAKFI